MNISDLRVCIQVGWKVDVRNTIRAAQKLIRSKQRKGGSSRIALNFCTLQICKTIFVKHLTNL